MGVWYLLTLFSYRLVLPEVKKIRGVLILGILLTLFTCLGSFDGDFAIKKTLGFFVYFIAGNKVAEMPRCKIPRWLARTGLTIILLLLISISFKMDWYSTALTVLSRGANIENFTHWYIAPIAYTVALIGTAIVMLLVMNSLPNRCTWLEKQGTDTMPMYLSHLILFMVAGYLVNKNNWMITVGVSITSIILSLWLFSREWYRNIFHRVLNCIENWIIKED